MDYSDNGQFYSEAFARNRGLISDEDQNKLRNSRVAIAGLGAAGGAFVTTMARLGVGKFNLADNDVYEIVNMNRQAGAFVSTRGKSKVEVMSQMAKDINPGIDIKTFPQGITPENIDEFLKDVDLAMDAIDFFNIEARILFYRKAREHGVTVVGVAPVGFGASLLTFTPDGMKFEDYCGIKEGQSNDRKLLQFGMGLAPSHMQRKYYSMKVVNFHDKAVPSSVLSIMAVANMGVTQAYKILTGRKFMSAPYTLHFDPFVQKLKKIKLRWGNRGPIQRLKIAYVKKLAHVE